MIKPILFNTDMVRAILDGRKTSTRRCVKAKSKNACGFYVTFRQSDNAFMGVYDYDENEMQFDKSQTQPAYPDDILYVRETIYQEVRHYLDISGEIKNFLCQNFKYVATDEKPEDKDTVWIKRPSIHMPKEAARIFIKVIDVKVERLQDMNLDDFISEGISLLPEAFNDPENAYLQAKNIFSNDIWNATVEKKLIDTYGWNANPWVWVIEFEQCGKPEGWERKVKE